MHTCPARVKERAPGRDFSSCHGRGDRLTGHMCCATIRYIRLMNPGLLPFAEPTLADASRVRECVAAARGLGNDLSFANIYLLREKYATTVAMENGVLYRHYGGNGRLQGYAFPCGAVDAEAALCRIEADAAIRQRPLQFCLLRDDEAELLRDLRPGRFSFSADSGDADYLYRRSDLAELPGTAYHRKRNHIARFEKLFPDWRYEPLTADNGADALMVARAWMEGREEAAPALEHELRAIQHALEHIAELQLCGGLIRVRQQPVAMSIASFISPAVADVHYEKCLPAFRDAFPVINRELARCLRCDFINREEDLNQPGLRQAKESYRPALLLRKLSAYPLSSC